jgi:hypothetical protein
VAVILTKKGDQIFVDDCDYEWLNKHKWHLNKDGYAQTNIKQNGKYKIVSMHRLIMGITDSKVQVDHIDGNRVDNRQENLRLCTNSENCRNRGSNKNSKSGIKGLCYDKHNNRWKADITLNRKRHRKYFACNIHPDAKEKAIQWLKDNREKLHGDFARS